MGVPIFILTHGRPDRQITLDSLKDAGYTGEWYLVLDNLDDTADEYIENYGKNHVVVFDKKAWMAEADAFHNRPSEALVLYARNAVYQIAKDMGYKLFVQCDDDLEFCYRMLEDGHLRRGRIHDFDRVLRSLCSAYEETGSDIMSLPTVRAYIGGLRSEIVKKQVLRSVFNFFLCSTDRPIRFVSPNEDVVTYMTEGIRGRKFFSPFGLMMEQPSLGYKGKTTNGGMEAFYKSVSTYAFNSYGILACPSTVSLGMGKSGKITQSRGESEAFPKIIEEKWKK